MFIGLEDLGFYLIYNRHLPLPWKGLYSHRLFQWLLYNIIKALSNTSYLQDEGEILAYLGMQVTKDTISKTITLSQPRLTPW